MAQDLLIHRRVYSYLRLRSVKEVGPMDLIKRFIAHINKNVYHIHRPPFIVFR
ncbi:hypothetical protein SAMN05428962_1633 [Paenibacillus sp. BC26]|nr:hypothetical protein SAMN05428962_1633 [Paenibacillus sp. BC26]